jgi:hypothetical protein
MTYDEMIARRKALIEQLSPGAPPPPLSDEELKSIADQNAVDRGRWASYALSHPEYPVHE